MAQLREFAQNHQEFERLGVRVVAISAEGQDDARKVHEETTLRRFTVLSDPERAVIRRFGLVHEGGRRGEDIALRTTLFVDGDGVERFRIVSETVPQIPKSQDVIARIRALPGK